MTTIPPNAGELRGAVDLSSLVQRRTQHSSPHDAADHGDAANPAPASVDGLVLDGTDTNFSQFLDLSTRVPVIIDLWAEWCNPCKQLTPVLERLINEYNGRMVLVKVDVDANPQLAQAFQAQSIPAIATLIAGKPLQLFVGVLPEQQLRDVFEQVLQIAAENGVSGTVRITDSTAATPSEEPEPEPEPDIIPPLHQEARDAIERGDYAAAIEAYTRAIAQDPHDDTAVAGRAQVNLLQRLDGKSMDHIRSLAAAEPHNTQAQLDIADLDVSGGHIDDAFDRLLTLFTVSDPETKDTVRTRLVELFEIVGPTDPSVMSARKRLTTLLY